MARHQKIALIGARGYDLQSADVRVSSYPWNRLNDIANLSDFDTILLDLLSVPGDVDWSRFKEILNIHSMNDIVGAGGRIFVVGDPRFRITGQNLDELFLDWTAARFAWDDQPGDTIELSNDWPHKPFLGYLGNLKRWDYALRACALDREALGQMLNLDLLDKSRRRVRLEKQTFAWNRYKEDLAFSVNIVIERNASQSHSEWWDAERRHGPICFLPKISVSEDEALVTVLNDICGVEAGIAEPEWIATYEVPGQDRIDAQIADIRSRIEGARNELRVALEKRASARQCLKLLYERGQPLEVAVRDALRELGASVEDPKETGKEDGWITVAVGGTLYEGVLEVKSTKNEEFDEYGLKQLLDWIYRGVQLRGKKYKGVFVGSNSVDEPAGKRKAAFSDSWKKSSELHTIVALKTEDLYNLYVLSKSGRLATEAFWKSLFSTNGVFQGGRVHFKRRERRTS